jgi:hypothetical protein
LCTKEEEVLDLRLDEVVFIHDFFKVGLHIMCDKFVHKVLVKLRTQLRLLMMNVFRG